MKILCESELMKNQTHADLMTPGGRFRVLQTENGNSLFFSLGTDNILYLTRPATATKTGWSRLDLTSNLASFHPGVAISATVFDVSQNIQPGGSVPPQPGNIDLAVVINDGTSDHLYVSQGNTSTEDALSQGVTWTPVPYDDPERPRAALRIANLYLLQTPNGYINRYFIADLIADGNLVRRYFIDPSKQTYTHAWKEHYLSFDAEAGSVSSCIGQWPNDDVAGVYTLGTIGTTKQLQYQRTVASEQGTQARVYEFALPAESGAIATAIDANGNTHFFVAAEGALYFYPPGQAGVQQQVGTAVVAHAFFAGVSQLYAASNGTSTVVWAINGAGHLAHMSCPAGSENDATAWSPPFCVLGNVDRIAPYLNVQQSNTVMFARQTGGNGGGATEQPQLPRMTKFEQNAITTEWQQRVVPLPTESINHLVEYQSYTTHVRITDDDGFPSGTTSVPITITAKAPLTIDANGASHTLTANTPLALETDATGVLTIVEETTSLTGTCFELSVQPTTGPAVTAAVNPMSKVIEKLSAIKSGTDLANATKVVNRKGTKGVKTTEEPLLPGGTSTTDRDTVAIAVQQFVKTYKQLPQDGSAAASRTYASTAELVATLKQHTAAGNYDVWGVVYGDSGANYYEGEAAAREFGLLVGGSTTGRPPTLTLEPGSIFSTAWGDVVAALKWLWDKAVCFFVKVIDGIYHFFVKLGEAIYHFVIDSIYAVAHAVEFIFNKIAVFFKDLVEWLGFIFNWDDILRTHAVIKNILKLYTQRAVVKLGKIKGDIPSLFDTIKADIENWGHTPSGPATIGSYGKAPAPGQHQPQSNWAIHHLKTNAQSGTIAFTGGPSAGPDCLDKFKAFATQHQTKLQQASQNTQAQITKPIKSLSAGDVIERFVTIVLEGILDVLEDGIILIIDICEALVEGIADLIDAPIEIPIISPIYYLLTGDQLSILDLMTLVAAIPATIVYKVITETTPFPENATTHAIIAATSFEELRQALGTAGDDVGADFRKPQNVGASVSGRSLVEATVDLNLVAAIGADNVIFWNSLKLPGPVWSKSALRFINGCAFAGYLLYASPNILSALSDQGEWYSVANDEVTILAVIKTFVDNFHPDAFDPEWTGFGSPLCDVILNLLWLAPSIGSFVAHPSAVGSVGLSASLVSSASGIIAPGAVDPETEVGAGFWLAIQILVGIYGALSVAYAVAYAVEKKPSALPAG